jgi:hypothetical protein
MLNDKEKYISHILIFMKKTPHFWGILSVFNKTKMPFSKTKQKIIIKGENTFDLFIPFFGSLVFASIALVSHFVWNFLQFEFEWETGYCKRKKCKQSFPWQSCFIMF